MDVKDTAGAPAGDDGVHFVVHDGDYFYPLNAPGAGWGSTVCGTESARVYALRQVDGRGAWTLLAEAQVRTYPTHPEENARLLLLAKEALIEQGCLFRAGRPTEPPRAYRAPSVSLAAHSQRVWRRIAMAARRRALGRMRQPIKQWSIGVLPRSDFVFGAQFPWRQIRWIAPPENGFIADPFLVEDGARTWLFYERLMYSEGKGTLWAAALDGASATLSEEREVLRTPKHVSFPQVFKEGSEWYLLAEQAHSGTTSLFRATEFPNRWEKHRDLLPDFPGIDPILLKRDGKWWLFVTYGVYPCNESNLHLFMADDLNDEFVPHPMNPIRVDLRGSRMAGAFCEMDGMLIRPGQDCAERYGNGVIVFEIQQLDAQTYRERELHAWKAQAGGEYNQSFHTFCASREFVAVDAQRALPE
jgi:hypothetical protein